MTYKLWFARDHCLENQTAMCFWRWRENPFNNLKRIDEHTESIYGPALCVNSSFNVSTVSSVYIFAKPLIKVKRVLWRNDLYKELSLLKNQLKWHVLENKATVRWSRIQLSRYLKHLVLKLTYYKNWTKYKK